MVKYSLPTRKLPARPDLDQLKRQAKELLDAVHANDPDALAEARGFYRDADPAAFALHDAYLVLARSYGYDSWPKLKAYVDGVTVERLIGAVRSNDLEQVRSILKLRPELASANPPSANEHAALHYAVLGRMPDMVRVLMEFGADPHAGIYPRTEATTALTIAVERGYDEIATIIREVDKRRESGRPTADEFPFELRTAVQSRDEERAIAILEGRLDLIRYQHPADRRTLLHIASAILLPRLAAWLLDHGADANRPARDGSTPLDLAGSRGIETDRLDAIVALLREHGARVTPRSAVILGDADRLRALAADGDLVTPQDDRGWLLSLAVDHDQPEILKLLLDLGLDPDGRARAGDSDEIEYTWGMPLYQCVRRGDHAMAATLLERGADPNGQVYASGTPLSEAYGQRDETMIALLERFGGKSNPSMAGLYRRKDLALRLLAEHGDARLTDDGFGSGTVAEQLIAAAARGGDPEIMRLGMEHVDWPDGDARWYGALGSPLGFWNHWYGPWCHQEWDRTTYLTCFKMALARIGVPVRTHRYGSTILHEIVTMGDHVTPEEQVAFAAAALDAGARLDQRDDLLKSTPLGWACRWGREELARLFLDRGADPVESDAEPWATPAAWARKKGHDSILAMLQR